MASSLSPSPSTSSPEPLFPKFLDLPPEIRHQIWRFAVPVPGINFFNVHCIPNDHLGANRSNSPPWLYLDLRRLSIHDSDDEVSRYDPSAWQARETLRRVCREARDLCALSKSETANITLTRPRQGLFVMAGDGQIRHMTMFSVPAMVPEPLEYRTVSVRANDVLCLSVENCSFNMPLEEAVMFDDVETSTLLGWPYDPQLTPKLPLAISQSRICLSLARGDRSALAASSEVLRCLFSFSHGRSSEPTSESLSLLMLDAYKQELGSRRVEELTPRDEVLWDRFGDRYIALPWDSIELPAEYRLVKVCPENNNIRERYLQSVILRSPKRPVGYSM
ncbi:uncharacterized protein GGS22DRAFT_174752 [Annulohypoxylon maeteangense]|uniref:uncharacterized protein n=1 Tax=Annulohypoxylon maeteangense TaxID=1927788 RepID=UPI002007EBDC|nr:uncharacterized protein GGS22DRAFT_174752 [Annulohypoxylon maeteangense]KAI0880586.1 hypothetical protein GGS22DRAFT_174752 [Annulohypoxylon maeteangense]